MTETLSQTNVDRALLTPKESRWFFGTRCLIFLLSLMSVGCSFFGGFYVVFGGAFALVFPIIANVIWQLKLSTQFPPKSNSIHPNSSKPWLVLPLFFLPICDHIAYIIKRQFKKQSDDNVSSPLFRSESSDLMLPPGKIQTLVGNIQNHVAVAFITSCCQAFSVTMYYLSFL
ncbi:MAG: hypothetical protein F4Z14_02475 [Gammaproteobacteria bacterium]|nr:hypothetical protein [Gammaproteobacteria bacterium]